MQHAVIKKMLEERAKIFDGGLNARKYIGVSSGIRKQPQQVCLANLKKTKGRKTCDLCNRLIIKVPHDLSFSNHFLSDLGKLATI